MKLSDFYIIFSLFFVVSCTEVECFQIFDFKFRKECSEEYLAVTDFGADPSGSTDSSESVQIILENIYERGAVDAVLYFPKGKYRFEQVCSISLSQKDKPLLLKIVGESRDETIIECYNTEGIFSFDSKNKTSQISVEDITFRACIPNAGNAFSFIFPAGGNLHNRSFICSDVRVDSSDEDNYFAIGLNLYGQWRPLINRISVSFGCASPMGVGINVSGTYTPRIVGSDFSNTDTGILYDAINGEGGDFCNNRFFGVSVGVKCTSQGIEPHLNFESNKFDCLEYGIHIDARKFNFIRNNTFENSMAGNRSYSDIFIESTYASNQKASNHIISGNLFSASLNENRNMIRLGLKVSDVFIHDNIFEGKGTILNDEGNSINVVLDNNIIQ